MSAKILVVDDSLTIQKVVAITLAHEDCELVECHSYDELMPKLDEEQFSLILLDFTISEEKSCYQITEEILNLYPDVKILAMLGTFDSADEDKLVAAGIHDRITKPFESTRFISKCRELLTFDDLSEGISDETSEINRDELIDELGDDADDWEVNSSTGIDVDVTEEIVPEDRGMEIEATNSLANEVTEWGLSVPSVIGDNEDSLEEIDKPAVMGDGFVDEDNEEDNEEARRPQFDKYENDDDDEESGVFEEESTSLIEINEIIGEDNKLLEKDDVDNPIIPDSNDLDYPDIVFEDTPDTTIKLHSSGDTDLEKEISSDSSEEDFWSEDSTNSNNVASAIERLINIDQITEQVVQALGPKLDELVKAYCSDTIEKVAWDIIPDLAENLIKKEIKTISESV